MTSERPPERVVVQGLCHVAVCLEDVVLSVLRRIVQARVLYGHPVLHASVRLQSTQLV